MNHSVIWITFKTSRLKKSAGIMNHIMLKRFKFYICGNTVSCIYELAKGRHLSLFMFSLNVNYSELTENQKLYAHYNIKLKGCNCVTIDALCGCLHLFLIDFFLKNVQEHKALLRYSQTKTQQLLLFPIYMPPVESQAGSSIWPHWDFYFSAKQATTKEWLCEAWIKILAPCSQLWKLFSGQVSH